MKGSTAVDDWPDCCVAAGGWEEVSGHVSWYQWKGSSHSFTSGQGSTNSEYLTDFPPKLECSARSFYNGETHTNQDMCCQTKKCLVPTAFPYLRCLAMNSALHSMYCFKVQQEWKPEAHKELVNLRYLSNLQTGRVWHKVIWM